MRKIIQENLTDYKNKLWKQLLKNEQIDLMKSQI